MSTRARRLPCSSVSAIDGRNPPHIMTKTQRFGAQRSWFCAFQLVGFEMNATSFARAAPVSSRRASTENFASSGPNGVSSGVASSTSASTLTRSGERSTWPNSPGKSCSRPAFGESHCSTDPLSRHATSSVSIMASCPSGSASRRASPPATARPLLSPRSTPPRRPSERTRAHHARRTPTRAAGKTDETRRGPRSPARHHDAGTDCLRRRRAHRYERARPSARRPSPPASPSRPPHSKDLRR